MGTGVTEMDGNELYVELFARSCLDFILLIVDFDSRIRRIMLPMALLVYCCVCFSVYTPRAHEEVALHTTLPSPPPRGPKFFFLPGHSLALFPFPILVSMPMLFLHAWVYYTWMFYIPLRDSLRQCIPIDRLRYIRAIISDGLATPLEV